MYKILKEVSGNNITTRNGLKDGLKSTNQVEMYITAIENKTDNCKKAMESIK